jgi:hypothetical protein
MKLKLQKATRSYILVEHLTNELIVHKTNIPNSKIHNAYFVRLLRILADKVEKDGQIDENLTKEALKDEI